MKILWVDLFLGGHHQIGLNLGLGSFLKNGGYFGGLLKFQIFFGVLEIPDIFGGRPVDAGPEPTYGEKMSTPPPTGKEILDPPRGHTLKYSLVV